jgi:hypothetical protein
MHIKLILTMTVISVGTLTVAALPSVAAESDNKQKAISELKSLEDPTILLPRVWLDSEWNKFRDENSTLEETLGGLWAWRLSAEQEWAVRVKIPVTMSFAGDTVDDSNRTALGDIKVATGTAFRLSNTLRAGSGIELRMPSGTDDTLSDNTWRLQEFGTIAWDITPSSITIPLPSNPAPVRSIFSNCTFQRQFYCLTTGRLRCGTRRNLIFRTTTPTHTRQSFKLPSDLMRCHLV